MAFVALFLRANCENDDEMRAKLETMERRLAKMDTMEKRLAELDAMVMETRLGVMEQQQGKGSFTCQQMYMSREG